MIGPYARVANTKSRVNTRRIKRELKFRKMLTKYNDKRKPQLVRVIE